MAIVYYDSIWLIWPVVTCAALFYSTWLLLVRSRQTLPVPIPFTRHHETFRVKFIPTDFDSSRLKRSLEVHLSQKSPDIPISVDVHSLGLNLKNKSLIATVEIHPLPPYLAQKSEKYLKLIIEDEGASHTLHLDTRFLGLTPLHGKTLSGRYTEGVE